MREHESCEEAMNAALAKGRDGFAYFLAERCDQRHGELTAAREHLHDTTPATAPDTEAASGGGSEEDA